MAIVGQQPILASSNPPLQRWEEWDAESTGCGSSACPQHPTTPAPYRASTHLAVGVTGYPPCGSDGRFPFSPLGNVERQHYFPSPLRGVPGFVHDPELVCTQGFEWSALRKRADVGLGLPFNVATSMVLSRTSVA